MDNAESPLPTRMCTKDFEFRKSPTKRNIILQWSHESNTGVT